MTRLRRARTGLAVDGSVAVLCLLAAIAASIRSELTGTWERVVSESLGAFFVGAMGVSVLGIIWGPRRFVWVLVGACSLLGMLWAVHAERW